MKLSVLDLFSGIGGFSLGLEKTGGFETVAFCEIDRYCQDVLQKHFTGVPIFKDIKELNSGKLESTIGEQPQVIAGGFPCQDISIGSKTAKGIVGERSGLWSEMFRLIAECRPKYAIIENVTALRNRGLALVLQNLHSIGYDAEWHCIGASNIGAKHKRDRLWIISYPNNEGLGSCIRGDGEQLYQEDRSRSNDKNGSGATAAPAMFGESSDMAQALQYRQIVTKIEESDFWQKGEPRFPRVVDGVSSKVDRLRCIGNSVVPQIPELLGNAILERERIVNGKK